MVGSTLPHTILLLDDEPASRFLLQQVLLGECYHCLEAEEDEHALEILRSNRVDLVIQDLRRYRSDTAGCNFTEVVKSDPQLRQIPILILSSASQEKAAKLFSETGVNFGSIAGYQSKPFDHRELISKIKAILGD